MRPIRRPPTRPRPAPSRPAPARPPAPACRAPRPGAAQPPALGQRLPGLPAALLPGPQPGPARHSCCHPAAAAAGSQRAIPCPATAAAAAVGGGAAGRRQQLPARGRGQHQRRQRAGAHERRGAGVGRAGRRGRGRDHGRVAARPVGVHCARGEGREGGARTEREREGGRGAELCRRGRRGWGVEWDRVRLLKGSAAEVCLGRWSEGRVNSEGLTAGCNAGPSRYPLLAVHAQLRGTLPVAAHCLHLHPYPRALRHPVCGPNSGPDVLWRLANAAMAAPRPCTQPPPPPTRA